MKQSILHTKKCLMNDLLVYFSKNKYEEHKKLLKDMPVCHQ